MLQSNTAILNVADGTNPTAICQPRTVNLAPTSYTLTPSFLNNGSTDNCPASNLVFTASPAGPFTCANEGANNITLTATDLAGRTNTCTAVLTVRDATPPTAVCQNRTVNLDGAGNATVTAAQINNGSSDNCTSNANVNLTLSKTSFNCSDIGTNTVTLTVTDDATPANPAATCTATVTVNDNTDPNANCHGTRTFALTTTGPNTVPPTLVNNNSTDNCGTGALVMTTTPTVSCANIGTPVTVTLTVKDASNNQDQCTSSVTVTDGVNPTAVCKPTASFSLASAGANTIPGTVLNNGSSDNCTASGSLTFTTSPTVTCANIGTPVTVTLTVRDAANNTSTCTSSITVTDGVDPTANCNTNATYNLVGTTGTVTPSLLNNNSTDNCTSAGSLVLTTSPTVSCANIGTPVAVTLTVKDAANNTSTCVTNVTVVDDGNPTAVCQTTTISLNGSGTATLAAAAVNGGSSDQCAAAGSLSYSVSPSTFNCSTTGSQSVTLTVTDPASNSSTCTTNITVLENVAPTAICTTATIFFNFDGAGVATITPASLNNGSNDNCTSAGSLVLTATPATLGCATHNVAQSITLTVRDQSNNTSTCTATVAATDITPPNAQCLASLTVALDPSGNATLTPANIDNGSTDNCTLLPRTIDTPTFDCTDLGANPVVLTATDNHSLSSTCTTTVTVVDTTRPQAICRDFSVTLNASGTASITVNDIENGSSDECTPTGSLTKTLDFLTFNCSDAPSKFVVLTVKDASLNTDTCRARVTVQDINPPTASCQPATITLNASGNATLDPNTLNNGTTDNCGSNLVFSANKLAYTCADLGTRAVVMTVTDPGGNIRACSTTVTVTDLIDPVANCQNPTILLNSSGNGVVSAVSVNNVSTDNCSSLFFELDDSTFTCADLGMNNDVILSVTDASGNEDTCHARVNVTEASLPVANCTPIITRGLNSTGTYTLTPATVNNGSVDNCGNLNFTLSRTNFDCTDIGPNSVTLTASDGSSNNSTCTSTVYIVDSSGPTALCRNISVSLDVNGEASITLAQVNNGTYDNCMLQGITIDRTMFECIDVGANSVTLTAVDTAGNISNCLSTVTVIDPVAPAAFCKNDTLYLGPTGQATLTTSMVNNGSSDNCNSFSMALSKTSFNCSNIGPNNVSLTVTDQGGNSTVCVAQIRVMDTTPPVPHCKPSININLNNAGAAVVTVALINNGSTDNCGITGYSVSPPVVNCSSISPSGFPVRLKPHDAANNVDSCTTIVHVFDVTPPLAICHDVYIVLDSTGIFNLDANDVGAGSYDACSIATMTVTPNSFDCMDIDSNEVTLTVTDIHGNSSSCDAYAILPSVAGEASAHSSIIACGFNVGCSNATNGTAKVTMQGGCAPFTYNWSPGGMTTDSISHLGPGTYYVTVTDALGRTAVDSVTLTAPTPVTGTALPSAFACEGTTTGSILLSATGGNNCLGYTYLWNDGSTLEDRSNLAPGTYTVTITDGVGCTGTVTSTIAMSPRPLPNLGPDVQKCAGVAVTLTAAPGFLNYNWSNGASTSSTSVTNPGAYICTVTNTLGCIGRDTILVSNAPPPTNFITAQGSTTLCVGDTVVLNGGTFASYNWSTGATTQTIAVHGGAATVFLTVTDASGCTGIDTATVSFLQDTLAVPTVSPASPVELCDGESITLIATAGYTSYVWSNGDLIRTTTVSTAGSYVVTVTGSNGCSKVSAPVQVIVHPLPSPTITASGTTLLGPPSFASYQWFWNSTVIPSANSQNYSPVNTGPHQLEVTDANGCVGLSNILIVDSSGVSVEDQLISVFGMRVYPNPTDGRLVLEATRAVPGQLNLQVTDLFGRHVMRQQLIGLNHSTEIDLSQVAAGMYLVEVSHSRLGKAIFKVVVE